MKKVAILLLFMAVILNISAQEVFYPSDNQFRQMGTDFTSPNAYRAASGAPGQLYWQQEANYKISIRLDDEEQKIFGEEEIEYINHSPDDLNYLWIQLDQNVRKKDNLSTKSSSLSLDGPYASYMIQRYMKEFDGGFNIDYVTDKEGADLPVTVNYTMMRVDLPKTLKPGEKTHLKIKWWYNINDRMKDGGGRSGMEYFSEDDNYLYTIAQFFPRMAVYSDVEGWQNMQFTGRSEFALPFGDYQVEITVPSDHIVGATGTLLNPHEVLSEAQQNRYKKAHESTDKVVVIVTEDEALKAEQGKSKEFLTWKFKAENVRDFAFSSSRKFIWDAMAVQFGERTVLATSLYPKEGNPLWEKYSTRAVAHTLEVYSRFTFDYPYPVAYSVHTDRIGMEYPMMAFNGGRPEKDGTYSERAKWGLIGVIIHEVGHNYFPMIVNSDERQWTWMDEGLNTFLQGVTEREWDHNHPHPSGTPSRIVDYMKGDQSGITPIMINGALLMQFNNNAYAKPATGLNILRETIMGRELFDFAFKEYAQRWMFKHPTPEDFFRTMEDASAVDLDWFWRGWFYTTAYVDISLDKVSEYTISSGNPADLKALQKEEEEEQAEEIAVQRNRENIKSVVESDPQMRDFYDSYDPYEAKDSDKQAYKRYLGSLS
ncbi:MAG: M1 family metallopeptidase, partial [Bacteroides sp.]|nr:M1 family metallopeptidase [Bacteroides sp.]